MAFLFENACQVFAWNYNVIGENYESRNVFLGFIFHKEFLGFILHKEFLGVILHKELALCIPEKKIFVIKYKFKGKGIFTSLVVVCFSIECVCLSPTVKSHIS